MAACRPVCEAEPVYARVEQRLSEVLPEADGPPRQNRLSALTEAQVRQLRQRVLEPILSGFMDVLTQKFHAPGFSVQELLFFSYSIILTK